MIQQRKKDYLQRLIEEFFSKLHELRDEAASDSDPEEKRRIMNECFHFFFNNFEVKQSDDALSLAKKINDNDLLQQYAKLLLIRYEIVDIKDIDQLHLALNIVRYLEVSDKTYSWDRSILREDLLRLLDEGM